MGRDQDIVDEFLAGYNAHFGSTFRIIERPDEVQRQKQAVDALALDAVGQTLAIEHTLVQPFVGEKDDSRRFLTAIAPLEEDLSLRLPGIAYFVSLPVAAIPKGFDWAKIGKELRDWFLRVLSSIPEGTSLHKVPNVGFELALRIRKSQSPTTAGRILVLRSDMPDDFRQVVRKALKDKLPKLTKTRANIRILLLELDNMPVSELEIADSLQAMKEEYPDLATIDQIWSPVTVGRDIGCEYFATRVWPRSEAEWAIISVKCKPLSGADTVF